MKKLMIAALILFLAPCAWAQDLKYDKDLFITVATGGTSGVYYPIGGAIANTISGKLGLDTSVQATGASVENINLINTNRAELAIVMADAVSQAYGAFGAFSGKPPAKSLRGLTALYPNFVQIVTTAKTGIKSVKDLAGKRVGVGAPNSGVELNARLILEAFGMSYDDINEDYLSYREAIDQIKNGMVDAAFVTSGIPNSTVIDLSVSNDTVVLPIDGEAIANLKKKYPFFSAGVIPGGTYSQKEDVHTATITNLLLVNKSLPEDAVYAITKTIFENLDALRAAHNAARHISLENVATGMPVPFHPGAEKYFKEMGALK